MSDGLSQRELESYLWGAATLLRGLIDASDYKQYIFPLLFFKRLSDVCDEDYSEAFEVTHQDEGYAKWRASCGDIDWTLKRVTGVNSAVSSRRYHRLFKGRMRACA